MSVRGELAKAPERRCQPQPRKQSLGLLNRFTPPCGLSPIWPIPRLRQALRLFQGQQRSALQFPLLTPMINMLFRPEEEHRLSVEDDVIPPVMGRDSKMDQAGVALDLAIDYAQFQS